MKQAWVKVDPWDKKRVTTALEGGADAVLVPGGYADEVRALGRLQVVAPDGDLIPGQDVHTITLTSMEDEAEVIRLSQSGPVIVQCSDWTIIPLENLVARSANLFVEVTNAEDARTFLGILERGVDGVVITTPEMSEVKKILRVVKEISPPVELTVAQITQIKPLGMGDRVCVDTCTNMGKGEGMLIGNSSAALFLVHAESLENPYVAPRPFRVNAGPVHAYIRVPEGKTRYLGELAAGDEVLIVNHTGRTLPAVVGRIKLEKRPLMLVAASCGGQEFSTVVQNAETIRLTQPGGEAISVVHLKPGDEVLVALEEAGRHFGYKVSETIIEK
ncbi:MAG: 3-dehydroquinate synthase II [Deltaproteobacteria bacterium]|nr:3-dehydroquinate synthase II [Deltaproteobacteria bacterium]MBW1953314.1 3-dehydroquinate synthase II [Deltaproteobacteria bacterium]MBW1986821.1 3-dehydroquinate synthase II [Deltaproteobacteria bacterium]MBW2135241.1 3-dehydroquinate synthase II [Deltaproteobacteria bacterium]